MSTYSQSDTYGGPTCAGDKAGLLFQGDRAFPPIMIIAPYQSLFLFCCKNVMMRLSSDLAPEKLCTSKFGCLPTNLRTIESPIRTTV